MAHPFLQWPVPEDLPARRVHAAAESLLAAGQDHVFEGLDTGPGQARESLARQLAALDQHRLEAALQGPPPPAPPPDLSAVEALPFASRRTLSPADWTEARETGEALLAEGRVAAFLAAGGHGSRLGFDGPKGAYPIGPVTRRTLFQVYGESLRAVGGRYGRAVPLIVMTSVDNHDATAAFFQDNDLFGLDADQVILRPQASLPSFDDRWKVSMAGPGHMRTAPNGHGGFYGVLSDLEDRLAHLGVDTVFYFQVDNPLLRILDPAFLGRHRLSGSRFSTKVVPKTGPAEKMGVLCRLGGVTRVVEYSEIGEKNAALRDEKGELLFWAGNVANHVVDLSFALSLNRSHPLPLHGARKRSGSAGETVTVTKVETFIFDALPHDPVPLVFRTDRAEEFGPVKASAGADTPERARRMLSAKYGRWLARAGIALETDGEGVPLRPVEISPLTALDEADLTTRTPDVPGEGPVVL